MFFQNSLTDKADFTTLVILISQFISLVFSFILSVSHSMALQRQNFYELLHSLNQCKKSLQAAHKHSQREHLTLLINILEQSFQFELAEEPDDHFSKLVSI